MICEFVEKTQLFDCIFDLFPIEANIENMDRHRLCHISGNAHVNGNMNCMCNRIAIATLDAFIAIALQR